MFIGTNFKYKNLQKCNLVYIHGYNRLKALNSWMAKKKKRKNSERSTPSPAGNTKKIINKKRTWPTLIIYTTTQWVVPSQKLTRLYTAIITLLLHIPLLLHTNRNVLIQLQQIRLLFTLPPPSPQNNILDLMKDWTALWSV